MFILEDFPFSENSCEKETMFDVLAGLGVRYTVDRVYGTVIILMDSL